MMETLLGDAIEKGVAADAVICENEGQKAMVWKIRENRWPSGAHGKALKHDVGAGVARGGVHGSRRGSGAVDGAMDIIAFGHVGDGNIHFNDAAGRCGSGCVRLERG